MCGSHRTLRVPPGHAPAQALSNHVLKRAKNPSQRRYIIPSLLFLSLPSGTRTGSDPQQSCAEEEATRWGNPTAGLTPPRTWRPRLQLAAPMGTFWSSETAVRCEHIDPIRTASNSKHLLGMASPSGHKSSRVCCLFPTPRNARYAHDRSVLGTRINTEDCMMNYVHEISSA